MNRRGERGGSGAAAQGENALRPEQKRAAPPRLVHRGQNLAVAGLNFGDDTLEDVYRLFPILKQRGPQIAGSLSGGQQQILALGMSLMTKPSILLLDEPSTGLAPVIVNDVMDALRQINAAGTTIVIVEQNIPATLKVASRAVVLKAGRMIFNGSSRELEHKGDLWALF